MKAKLSLLSALICAGALVAHEAPATETAPVADSVNVRNLFQPVDKRYESVVVLCPIL